MVAVKHDRNIIHNQNHPPFSPSVPSFSHGRCHTCAAAQEGTCLPLREHMTVALTEDR